MAYDNAGRAAATLAVIWQRTGYEDAALPKA